MKLSTCFCLSGSSSRSPLSCRPPAGQIHRSEQIARRQLVQNALGCSPMRKIGWGVALLLFTLGMAGAARAKGLAKLKGQIIVSAEDLPVLDDEEKMVAELKRLHKTVIE